MNSSLVEEGNYFRSCLKVLTKIMLKIQSNLNSRETEKEGGIQKEGLTFPLAHLKNSDRAVR